MSRIWTKICGTTNLEDAQLAWQFNADAIGFVFVEHSARRVTAEQVRTIVNQLARPIERIGVVEGCSRTASESRVERSAASPEDSLGCNAASAEDSFGWSRASALHEGQPQPAALAAEVRTLVDLFNNTGLSGLQLHSDEPPEFVRELRKQLPKARLIKGLHVHSAEALTEKLALYKDCGLDNILLDSSLPGQSGGTGTRFDWSAAAEALRNSGNRLPIIIAGGLTPENVSEAIATFHPFGVDVVSGIEREKGKKDPDKLRRFLDATRATSAQEVSQ
jgi:phosphoribosylanthranilate isomerase